LNDQVARQKHRSYPALPSSATEAGRSAFLSRMDGNHNNLIQCRFKPYRIIYRVMDKTVYVLLIVDGRRDMQPLLERRLLDGE